jgi:probable phosphoglycerate mutase
MAQTLQKVYLVRHGETAWTLSGQATGRTDLALTANGEREAEELRPRLRDLHPVAVLTSPLLRARRTAELAGFGEGLQNDDDLMEWNYGAYEGRRTSEIQAAHPGWRLFRDGCPEGEVVDQVGARADRVIARVRQKSGDVALFAHRDILRVLAARWLGFDAASGRCFQLGTASLSELGYEHNISRPVIRLWNEARHAGA